MYTFKSKTMFNFLQRSKPYNWEKEMLIEIFRLLPSTFLRYEKQLTDGLIKRVILGSPTKKNYVGFTFNPLVSKRYEEKENNKINIIEDVLVFDLITDSFVTINIYLAFGLVIGYSSPNQKKIRINPNVIDLTKIKFQNLDNIMVEDGVALLTEEEKSLLDINDVYELTLNGKLYYHLVDIKNGDGDFVGIDSNKCIFIITHDPFEINLVEGPLSDILHRNR